MNKSILPTDIAYPILVKERIENPPTLYYKGNLSLLKDCSKNIAIVGAIAIDDEITQKAIEISGELASCGYNIVSGYARGSDSCAHLGAIKSGGNTIVVSEGGINKTWIKRELKKFITDDNLLFVSQFLPEENWTARGANIKDKTIIALSKIVIVMACGIRKDKKKSGSFKTAEKTLNMGVPLFILSPEAVENPPVMNRTLINLGGIEFSNAKEIIDKINILKLN